MIPKRPGGRLPTPKAICHCLCTVITRPIGSIVHGSGYKSKKINFNAPLFLVRSRDKPPSSKRMILRRDHPPRYKEPQRRYKRVLWDFPAEQGRSYHTFIPWTSQLDAAGGIDEVRPIHLKIRRLPSHPHRYARCIKSKRHYLSERTRICWDRRV